MYSSSTKTFKTLYQVRISLKIFAQCSSHLVPEMDIMALRPVVLLMWQQSLLGSVCVKNQIFPLATLESDTESSAGNTHGSHIFLTLLIRLLGVDDPWLKKITWNYSLYNKNRIIIIIIIIFIEETFS